MIKEKPFTGFGPHGFTANYMHYQGEYLKKEGNIYEKQLADNNHYVYNEPLRWTVEYGVAGLHFILEYYIAFSHIRKERYNLYPPKRIHSRTYLGIIFLSRPDFPDSGCYDYSTGRNVQQTKRMCN